MNLIFDLETDGLYNSVSRIHCLCVHDLCTDQTYVFNDEGSEQPISKGIQLLEDASTLIGHNIINYDIPVIKKLYPWFDPSGELMDTLVLSRVIHSDILKIDQKRRWPHMPLQLYGRHSLEA